MKDKDGVPDASEFGLLRAYLAQNGFSQEWINQHTGTNVSGRTRAQITAQLIEGLKVLPKATV